MAKKILLADDSPTIRKVVELTFADEGIEVHSVPDGDSAMVTFVRIEPDMVIADVNMPGMTGYRLCEMIKQDETTRHIPVILLVGSFEPFDPGEASRVGCDHYFTKPFRSIRELVEKVNECLAPEYGGATAYHDTADIEDLYSSSMETDLVEPRPEDEVPAFAAAGESMGETQFDDGTTLDQFLSESTRGQVVTGSFGQMSAPDRNVEPTREFAAAASGGGGQFSDDSEILDPFDGEGRTADGCDDGQRAPEPVTDDNGDDDVLGIGSSYRSERSDEDDLLLDIEPSGHAATPVNPHNEDVHLTSVPPARGRQTGDLGPSPWEQPVADEPVGEAAISETENVSERVDILGDAGMDDEIIETSHPSPEMRPETIREPAADLVQNAARIDPFTERVGESQVHEQRPPDHHSELVHEDRVDDRVDTADQPDPEMTASPEQAAPALGAHVTPELIESIVASVLEKMSERAVRDAAQEAVPRIAEKLIREALTEDKRGDRADAAND